MKKRKIKRIFQVRYIIFNHIIKAESVHNFILMDVIGRGGFGKVWKVKRKKNKMAYALKIMSKAKYSFIIKLIF